jgi:hypothetical protein
VILTWIVRVLMVSALTAVLFCAFLEIKHRDPK